MDAKQKFISEVIFSLGNYCSRLYDVPEDDFYEESLGKGWTIILTTYKFPVGNFMYKHKECLCNVHICPETKTVLVAGVKDTYAASVIRDMKIALTNIHNTGKTVISYKSNLPVLYYNPTYEIFWER